MKAGRKFAKRKEEEEEKMRRGIMETGYRLAKHTKEKREKKGKMGGK